GPVARPKSDRRAAQLPRPHPPKRWNWGNLETCCSQSPEWPTLILLRWPPRPSKLHLVLEIAGSRYRQRERSVPSLQGDIAAPPIPSSDNTKHTNYAHRSIRPPDQRTQALRPKAWWQHPSRYQKTTRCAH